MIITHCGEKSWERDTKQNDWASKASQIVTVTTSSKLFFSPHKGKMQPQISNYITRLTQGGKTHDLLCSLSLLHSSDKEGSGG